MGLQQALGSGRPGIMREISQLIVRMAARVAGEGRPHVWEAGVPAADALLPRANSSHATHRSDRSFVQGNQDVSVDKRGGLLAE